MNKSPGDSTKKKSAFQKKVVIRRLPPSWNQETCLEQISPLPEHDYFRFVPPDNSLGEFGVSRAYISFTEEEDVYSFTEKFNGYEFVDSKGNKFLAVVEFASNQKIPSKSPKRVDSKKGSLEQDADYLSFLESLKNAEATNQVNVESLLEELEARNSKRNEVLNQQTPLIEFLRKKREEKKALIIKQREERRRKELERKKQRDEERRRRRDEREREIRIKQKERTDRLKKKESPEVEKSAEEKKDSPSKTVDRSSPEKAERSEDRSKTDRTRDQTRDRTRDYSKDSVAIDKSSKRSPTDKTKDVKSEKTTRSEERVKGDSKPERVKPTSYSARRNQERERRERERAKRGEKLKQDVSKEKAATGDGDPAPTVVPAQSDVTTSTTAQSDVTPTTSTQSDVTPSTATQSDVSAQHGGFVPATPPGLKLEKPAEMTGEAAAAGDSPETKEVSESPDARSSEAEGKRSESKSAEPKPARDDRKKRYKDRPERALYVPRRARQKQANEK